MNKIWKGRYLVAGLIGRYLVAGLIVSNIKGKSCEGEAQHEKRHGGMVCGCGFGGCGECF